MQVQLGKEFCDKNSAASFPFGSVKVDFWAAIAYKLQIPLICICKHRPDERVTQQNLLGTNSALYATEIYEFYLTPFFFLLAMSLQEILVMDNIIGYH